jgi:hypothetical protein
MAFQLHMAYAPSYVGKNFFETPMSMLGGTHFKSLPLRHTYHAAVGTPKLFSLTLHSKELPQVTEETRRALGP